MYYTDSQSQPVYYTPTANHNQCTTHRQPITTSVLDTGSQSQPVYYTDSQSQSTTHRQPIITSVLHTDSQSQPVYTHTASHHQCTTNKQQITTSVLITQLAREKCIQIINYTYNGSSNSDRAKSMKNVIISDHKRYTCRIDTFHKVIYLVWTRTPHQKCHLGQHKTVTSHESSQTIRALVQAKNVDNSLFFAHTHGAICNLLQ